jgi:hypothetical protein
VSEHPSSSQNQLHTGPEKTGRVFWIILGISVIGGVFWLLLQGLVNGTGFRFLIVRLAGNASFDLFGLISLIILWSLGALWAIGSAKKESTR